MLGNTEESQGERSSCNMKFAEVLFTSDNVIKIVPMERIKYNRTCKGIKPQNYEDFDKTHKYLIQWYFCGRMGEKCDEDHQHSFRMYHGYIFKLGESIEDIERHNQIKRHKIPNRRYQTTTTTTTSTESESEKTTNHEALVMKKTTIETKKRSLQKKNDSVLKKLKKSYKVPPFPIDSDEDENHCSRKLKSQPSKVMSGKGTSLQSNQFGSPLESLQNPRDKVSSPDSASNSSPEPSRASQTKRTITSQNSQIKETLFSKKSYHLTSSKQIDVSILSNLFLDDDCDSTEMQQVNNDQTSASTSKNAQDQNHATQNDQLENTEPTIQQPFIEGSSEGEEENHSNEQNMLDEENGMEQNDSFIEQNMSYEEDEREQYENPNEDEQNMRIEENVQRAVRKKLPHFLFDCIVYYKNATDESVIEEKEKRYSISKEKKVYLGEGISIDAVKWDLMQIQRPSVFLSELALVLWTPSNLANRALDLTKGIINIPHRSPVRLIEPNLLRLFISLFYDYLKRDKNINNNERVKYLMDTTYILKFKIRDLRAIERRAKAVRRNQNSRSARRVLRYNYVEIK